MKNSDLKSNKFLYEFFTKYFNITTKNFYENYEKLYGSTPEEKKEEIKEEIKESSDEKKEEIKESKDEKKEEIKESKDEKKDEMNPIKEELIQDKLTLIQMHQILIDLGFCSKSKFTFSLIKTETKSQIDESKLVNMMFDALKKENEERILLHDLKNFLDCILNLYNYKLYLMFKEKNISEKEVEKHLPEKFTQDDKLEYKLNQIIEEIKNKQDPEKSKKNKFVSFEKENGNIIIPPKKAFRIFATFTLFNMQYSNKCDELRNISQREKKEKNLLKNPKSAAELPTFKPKINEKSSKMYEKIKEKILNEEIEDFNNTEVKEEDKHMKYIDKLILRRKRLLMEYSKRKEEEEKKEIEKCTFKPLLENKYTISKARGANRFNELFKKGTEKEKNRKNRTKEDFDYEKYGKECSFKPNMSYEEIPVVNFKNDIFKEKSYQLLYDRLKKGRFQREIKEAVNDRYAFNEELLNFINNTKEGNYSSNYSSIDNSNLKRTVNNENQINESKEIDGNLVNKENEAESDKINCVGGDDQEEGKSCENENEDFGKKEAVPLLIIDVNVRAGVKKKIYVYDGDTAEGLAEKFAKEHNLEPQTQEKLQNLIQNHMLRLLTRIDEENPSISEKSGIGKSQKSD